MKYASVSVKFPVELDTETEQFLDETGMYTNKCEFIKETCHAHLREFNNDTTIAALQLEQLLAQAEQSRESDNDIDAELAALGENVDSDNIERVAEEAHEETSEHVYESDA